MKSSALPQMKLNPPTPRRGEFHPPTRVDLVEKDLVERQGLFLAGVEGLEPSQTVLETGVLPLTPYPYFFF